MRCRLRWIEHTPLIVMGRGIWKFITPALYPTRGREKKGALHHPCLPLSLSLCLRQTQDQDPTHPAQRAHKIFATAVCQRFVSFFLFFFFFVRRHNQNFDNITRVARILTLFRGFPVSVMPQINKIAADRHASPIHLIKGVFVCFPFAGKPRNLGGGVEVGHLSIFPFCFVLSLFVFLLTLIN